MSFTTIYMVTDNAESVEKAKAFWESHGVQVKIFSTSQWNQGLDSHSFRSQLNIGVPQLAGGHGADGAKVLSFPTNSFTAPPGGLTVGGSVIPLSKVSTMDEIESKAIETAIHQFKGNLTEAARALGIGRATLYRKVKQYQIDPGMARKKKAA